MARQQLSIDIHGQVQGVGFRPLLYRLAIQYQQTGWVANTPAGVHLILQGAEEQQHLLLEQLQRQPPTHARIVGWDISQQAITQLYPDFQIIDSQENADPIAFVSADLAPCAQCLADIENPDSRFYQYPFTSCCDCGPRFSIINRLPFERRHTSMAEFAWCADCERSYHDPLDRRFHAQTLCCPNCGPQLNLYDANSTLTATHEQSLPSTLAALQAGQIVAIKGVGGFQFCVDATQASAVQRLRQRKHRLHKPLAVMVANLTAAQALCHINHEQAELLQSPQAPIVLLPVKPHNGLAAEVNAGSAWLGLMLPASPLHYRLANGLNVPLVVTSGNQQGHPLCIDNRQALASLSTIADYFLLHNRVIQRPLDDSVVKIIANQVTVLRSGRGYAPTMIPAPASLPPAVALGGHFANSLALNIGRYWLLGPYIGDLENVATREHFQNSITDLQKLYRLSAQHLLHDRHPDYFSTRLAQDSQLSTTAIPHHYAHILACMAEHQLKPPVLGFAWDGTGLSEQDTLCGSEVLLITANHYQRLAHLRPFALPGGDVASHRIYRLVFAMLWQLQPVIHHELPELAANERALLEQMLRQQLNCPLSSSAGRMFDAMASLLNLTQNNHFQGQAAMQLEQLADQSDDQTCYPFTISSDLPAEIDWRPMLKAVLNDLPHHSPADIAARFHNTLAAIMLQIASQAGIQSVVLSGGCFQNANLSHKAVKLLQEAGLSVFRHQRIPPNDGGLAIGQLYGYCLRKTVTIR